ncbi:MAG: ATP-binding cassette domain-containing protein, partial [Chloroflexota bacterium]
EKKFPWQLSGGMQQRAAFLRTFMMERPLVLLDEPLSALDAITRAEIQDWLLGVWRHFNYTIVMVTHDVHEAVYMADRVVVLSARPGKIVRTVEVGLARPRERTNPAFHRYVAELMAAITV